MTCKNCKIEFTKKTKNQVFCIDTCRAKFYSDIFREKQKSKVIPKTFPKYVNKKGEEIQLDFDPLHDTMKWTEFLANQKAL